MLGWRFTEWTPEESNKNRFEELLEVFRQLLMYTAGDSSEALGWMTELDRQYHFTDAQYGMADFIDDLIEKGYLKPMGSPENSSLSLSAKMEVHLRRSALDDIFDDLSKSGRGKHQTRFTGKGDEETSELRKYEYGDPIENIAVNESLKNAISRIGFEEIQLSQEDLEVRETYYQTQASTVLMIDISHSMILYGEDRITPARKVAMALSEWITSRFPKDTLDIIVFGNDAWKIELADLPYLRVGPYHTNTVAGLELAMEILSKKRNPNKQILMITDGKPTCIKQGKNYYKNSFGLDKKILTRTLSLAHKCRKLNIPITTFMIATDPWLVSFIDQFTRANGGKAFYSSLDRLGEFVFKNYKKR
jgi:Ca-activated chloride channel family protein